MKAEQRILFIRPQRRCQFHGFRDKITNAPVAVCISGAFSLFIFRWHKPGRSQIHYEKPFRSLDGPGDQRLPSRFFTRRSQFALSIESNLDAIEDILPDLEE